MKFLLRWNTVHTDEEMGNTVTTAQGYLLPVPEDGSRTGSITVRLLGNHFAAFAYADGNEPGEPFDIPMPEVKRPTPKTNGLRIVTLDCGHDVWAHTRLQVGDFAPCQQHRAARIVAIWRDVSPRHHPRGCCCAPCRAKVM